MNRLKEILGDPKYNIKQFDDRIIIDYGENYYPEDCIEIKINESDYEVREVHRDRVTIGVKTNKEDDAIVFGIVLCKRLFESNNRDVKIISSLLELVKNNNIDDAVQLLKDNLIENKYSLTYEYRDKICLIKHDNKCDIMFHGKKIVENSELSRGFAVLYNYTRNLMEIDKIYSVLKNNFNFTYEQQELEDIYIFGID